MFIYSNYYLLKKKKMMFSLNQRYKYLYADHNISRRHLSYYFLFLYGSPI